MRICVVTLALVAVAQPAFARSHSHKHAHQARAHHVRHLHHAVHARAAVTAPDAAQAFVRTEATDRPFFSDPSFPNRSWSQNRFPAQAWSEPAQPSFGEPLQPSFGEPAQPSFGEPAPRLRTARVRTARVAGALDAMIARHAAANGLPVELVHRVVKRESGYNPRASSRGNLGLMQIRYGTARGVGYTGSAAGLLNPETNLTYAVRYLAGAYRAAGGNASRAVTYYGRGYRGRGVVVAQRRAIPADSWGWQSQPVSMRSEPSGW